MTANGWVQIAIYFLLILVCVKPLGLFPPERSAWLKRVPVHGQSIRR